MTKNGMAGHGMDEGDVLDFPGAGGLRAAGEVAPVRPEAVAAALTAVRAAAASAAANGTTGADGSVVTLAPGRERARPARRMRRILISAAAVAAIAAGATVYPIVGIGEHQPVAQAGAADFLRQVGDTAGAQQVVTTHVWKVRTRVDYGLSSPQKAYTLTKWLSRDQVLQSMNGEPAMKSGAANSWELAPNGSALFVLVGQISKGAAANMTGWRFLKGAISWDDLGKLPTRPTALRSELLRCTTGGSTAEAQLFDVVDTLLGNAPADPALRAALYKVAAGIPHVRLLGHAKDAAGREGTAVEMPMGKGSSRMIIDPATGKLLETQLRPANPSRAGSAGSASARLIRFTYLSTGPVSKVTAAVAPSSPSKGSKGGPPGVKVPASLTPQR